MFRRNKKQNEEWYLKAYRMGDRINGISENMSSRIIAKTALNNEELEPSFYVDLPYFTAALLIAILDMDLYFIMDAKKRRGREAVMGKVFEGFMAAFRASYAKAHNKELPKLKEREAEISINVFLQDLRNSFDPSGGGSGMLGITKEFSEVYANRLIEKYGLSIPSAKFVVGLASKATTEIAAASAGAKW